MSDEVLVRCENVSKKFCRSLKRSLWYGVQDIGSELNPFSGEQDIVGTEHCPKLRKNEFWAVDNVSFELKRGDCLGLIGHNGAGKSTLLKMLNGLIKPDHGRITMRGSIGALIELNAGFNPILTGRENIYIYGSILGCSKKEIDQKYDDIVEFSELADFMEMPFRSYSSGMKVRLGFSVAVQMEPDVLLIDEVLAVGDLGFRMKCYNAIGRLLENAAVIFVSHSMPYIARICNEVIYMDKANIKLKTNDVPVGIKYYYQKFGSASQQVTGSKEAEISGFRFRENGKSKITINAGEGTIFDFDLHIKDSRYEDGCLKIEIWNQELRPSVEVIPENNSFCVNKARISISIPELRLTAGEYMITITVRSKVEDQILCRVANIGTLVIDNDVVCAADSYAKATVTVSSQHEEANLSHRI